MEGENLKVEGVEEEGSGCIYESAYPGVRVCVDVQVGVNLCGVWLRLWQWWCRYVSSL